MHAYLFVVVVSASAIFRSSISELLVRPAEYVTVLAGQQQPATLTCQTDVSTSPVSWTFLPVGHTVPRTLFINGRVVSSAALKYNVTSTSGSSPPGVLFHLTVSAVELTDAGRFTCRENNGRAGSLSADTQLTVLLNSSMDCMEYSSDEDDIVYMQCLFYYVGNVFPRVIWRAVDADMIINSSTRVVQQHSVNNFTVNYVNSSIRFDSRRSAVRLSIYSCVVMFNENTSRDQQFVYQWNSTVRNTHSTVGGITYSNLIVVVISLMLALILCIVVVIVCVCRCYNMKHSDEDKNSSVALAKDGQCSETQHYCPLMLQQPTTTTRVANNVPPTDTNVYDEVETTANEYNIREDSIRTTVQSRDYLILL